MINLIIVTGIIQNRIEKQIQEWKDDGCTNYDIARGLANGSITHPSWMGKRERPDGVEIFDMDKEESSDITPYYFFRS